MTAQVQDLPLRELFDRLRAAGLPLGIDDYFLLLAAVQSGYGLPDAEALARLCCMLWTSSREEAAQLRFFFNEIMSLPVTATTIREQAESMQGVGAYDQTPDVLSLDNDLEVFQVPLSTSATEAPGRGDLERQAPDLTVQVPRYEEPGRAAYLLGDEFYPISERQMKQTWRHLRRPVREGPRVELDVTATVREIERLGLLLEPVLLPLRVNRVGLVFFADQHGSMTPFHDLTRRLTTTATRGGRLGSTNIYYFHNAPSEVLYHDAGMSDAVPLEQFLAGLHSDRTVVLVFSDAGAARGMYNHERLVETEAFLERLRKHVRHVAWLNPLPTTQWSSTTAADIARRVPMFELSRRGLQSAVDTLRGRVTR